MNEESYYKFFKRMEVALDPELEEHLVKTEWGTMIQHPLVHGFLSLPGLANEQLIYKQTALAKAKAESDWGSYIFLHERPYRVQAFLDVEDELDDDEYWQLLLDVWTDTEEPRTHIRVWYRLWKSARPKPDGFIKLPNDDDTLRVYRGGHGPDLESEGLSWTLSRKVAEKFAGRWGNDGRVIKLTVPREYVLGYTDQRGEQEVIHAMLWW